MGKRDEVWRDRSPHLPPLPCQHGLEAKEGTDQGRKKGGGQRRQCVMGWKGKRSENEMEKEMYNMGEFHRNEVVIKCTGQRKEGKQNRKRKSLLNS